MYGTCTHVLRSKAVCCYQLVSANENSGQILSHRSMRLTLGLDAGAIRDDELASLLIQDEFKLLVLHESTISNEQTQRKEV